MPGPAAELPPLYAGKQRFTPLVAKLVLDRVVGGKGFQNRLASGLGRFDRLGNRLQLRSKLLDAIGNRFELFESGLDIGDALSMGCA